MSVIVMPSWSFWLCLIVLCGSGLASDVPFVFGENNSDLASYSSVQLEEASSSSADLVGVPLITSPSDSEILEIPITGGGSTSEGELEKKVGDLKDELNKKVEPNYVSIHENAAMQASKYPGDLRIDQICEIYYYLKYGDGTKSGWKYVRDTRGIDSWNYANDSLKIGERVNCVGLGDCDDFAILMAAFVESIGGATRIILANNDSIGGHAYTEVYLGQLENHNYQVEEIFKWLQQEFETNKIYGHIDTDTKEAWLNLDWGPDEKGNAHPGGPLFQGDKHYVLRIRDEYRLIPLRMPESVNKPPRLISLTSDKKSPQDAGSVVIWTAKATDPEDQILYRFFLDNYPVTNWKTNNTWVWTTSEADIGDHKIEVYIRDGKHAGPNRFDSNTADNFSIHELSWDFDKDLEGWERVGTAAPFKTEGLFGAVKWEEKIGDSIGVINMDACYGKEVNASAGIKKIIKIPINAKRLDTVIVKYGNDGGIRFVLIDESGSSHTLGEHILSGIVKESHSYDISSWAGETVTLDIKVFGYGTTATKGNSCTEESKACCGEYIGIDSLQIT
jgi:hypothetical protein